MSYDLRKKVSEIVDGFCNDCKSFTSLDASNGVKINGLNVKHSDVSSIVRNLYMIGSLSIYSYERTLIDVVVNNNSTKSYLYHRYNVDPKDYKNIEQTAINFNSIQQNALEVAYKCLRDDYRIEIPPKFLKKLNWEPNSNVYMYTHLNSLILQNCSSVTFFKKVKVGANGRLFIFVYNYLPKDNYILTLHNDIIIIR